jgi:predicted DNA-binding protein (MmcQ/YjbR family)
MYLPVRPPRPPKRADECRKPVSPSVQLRAAYPAIGPGYHLNKRHWNTITLDGSVADDLVRDLLGDSYDLVVASLPKARRPAGAAGAAGTGSR